MPHDSYVRGRLTPWFIAAVLALAAIAVAITVIPWNAQVAPWSAIPAVEPTAIPLQSAAITRIEQYQEASAWPLFLAWISPVAAALIWCSWSLVHRQRTSVVSRQRISRQRISTVIGITVIAFAPLPFLLWITTVRRDAGLDLRSAGVSTRTDIAGALLVAAVAITVVFVVDWLARRWPARWWQVAVPVVVVLVVAGSWLTPLIATVSNQPPSPLLLAEVDALQVDQQVSVIDVSVAEVSQNRTTVNAVVTGFGATTHLSVYDTLLTDLSTREVSAVLRHEVAHVVHDDVWWATAISALAAGALTAALAAGLHSERARRFVGIAPSASSLLPLMPVLAVFVTVVAAMSTPVVATVSRPVEIRADVTAVTTATDEQALTDAIWQMSEINLAAVEPPRWRYVLFATHPTPSQRVSPIADVFVAEALGP